MSTSGRSSVPRRVAGRRIGAAIVILLALVLALALLARPSLLVTLGLSIVAGFLFRVALWVVLIARRPRSSSTHERAVSRPVAAAAISLQTLAVADADMFSQVADAPPPPKPQRRALFTIAAAAVVVGVALIVAGLAFFHARQVDLAPVAPKGVPKSAVQSQPAVVVIPHATTIHRYHYASDPTLQHDGSWKGDETFTLMLAEAKELVGRGTGPIADRLQAVMPAGWTATKVVVGGKVKYQLTRPYTAPKIDFVSVWPFTSAVSLPAPELHAGGLRHVLFAAEGSVMTLTAPKKRIYDTAPPSKVEVEGRSEVRTIELDVVGPAAAGSGVDLEVESDAAMHATQETLGKGFGGLIALLTSIFGASFGGAAKWLLKLIKDLFKRDKKPKPTPRIIRGQDDATKALIAYLKEQDVTSQTDIDEAIALIADEANALAKKKIAESDNPADVEKRYVEAHETLIAQGVSAFDAVRRALETAGLPREARVAIDAQLDRKIVADYGPEPPVPAPAA